MTGYQPIRDQYFPIRSIPAICRRVTGDSQRVTRSNVTVSQSHFRRWLFPLCPLGANSIPNIITRWREVSEVGKFTLESSPSDPMVQNMALLVLEELGHALAAQTEM